MAALGCALDLRYLGSSAALGTLDLRYLGSGAALGNLVQGLAIPHQRALAGWLRRDITSSLMIMLRLSVAPLAVSVAPRPHPQKEEAITQLPQNYRRQGHHATIAGAGFSKANKTSEFFTPLEDIVMRVLINDIALVPELSSQYALWN